MKKRILSIEEIAKKVRRYRAEGRTVAMITGNFDVLHLGHIRLFNFAANKCDVLIVGIDSDEIAEVYRKKVPATVNNEDVRAEVVNNLQDVTHVFKIHAEEELLNAKDVHEFHCQLLEKINPTHVATNPLGDLFYEDRKSRCERRGVKLLEVWTTDLLKE